MQLFIWVLLAIQLKTTLIIFFLAIFVLVSNYGPIVQVIKYHLYMPVQQQPMGLVSMAMMMIVSCINSHR